MKYYFSGLGNTELGIDIGLPPPPFFLSYPLPFYFYGISLEFEITNRHLRFGLNYCIVNDAWNDPSVDACSTDQPILCAFSFLNRRILLITFQGNLSSFFFSF